MTIIQEIAENLSCNTDTIVTVVVTLSVFITGLIFNILVIKIKEKIERKKYKRYFKNLIKNIIDYTNRQVKEFDQIIKSLDVKSDGSVSLSHVSASSLHLIDKLSFDKLYDAYFFSGFWAQKKIRTKAFNIILDRTELIRRIDSNLPMDILSFDKKFRVYEDQWNYSVTGIRQLYDKYRQKYAAQELDKSMIDFLIDFDCIIKNWLQQENSSHRYCVKTFIIDKFDDKFYIKYKNLEPITILQNHWIDARAHYNNMDNICKLYAGQFKNYRTNYINYRKIAFNALIILNNGFFSKGR